jgi:phage terminase large subunit-like protein
MTRVSPDGDPAGRLFSESVVDVIAAEVIEPGGGSGIMEISGRSTPSWRTERRDVIRPAGLRSRRYTEP